MAQQIRYLSNMAGWAPTGGAGATAVSAIDGSYVSSSGASTSTGGIALDSPFAVPLDATVNFVRFRITYRLASAGSARVRPGFNGSLQVPSPSLSTNTTWVTQDYDLTVYQTTGLPWTPTDINGLTTGLFRQYDNATSVVVQVDYFAVIVDYTEGEGGEPDPDPVAIPDVSTIYSGASTPISRVYSGSTLIWPNGGDEEPPIEPPSGELDLATYTAAMARRTVFGHQSVGWQVLQGVEMWADELGAPEPTFPDYEGGGLPGSGGFLGHFYCGTNGDSFTKTAEFLSHLQNGLAAQVDIVVLKFCYADMRSGSGYTPQQMFDDYKAWVDAVESQFPQLTVIYATEAIVMGQNSDGANNGLRQTFNNLVRAEYGASGRLWDVADIQSTDPSGNKVLYGGVESLYSGYASPDQRHIYGLGRTTVAAPLLQIIAELPLAGEPVPKLYVAPATGSYSVGATLQVQVRVDSQAEEVNVIQANLTYPSAQLELQSIDRTGSPFVTAMQEEGADGEVHLSVGILAGSASGDNLVATLTFAVTGTGTAQLAFAPGSGIASYPDAIDICQEMTGGTYEVS